MATDIDIEMDLDIGVIDNFQQTETPQHLVQPQPSFGTTSAPNDLSSLGSMLVVPNKVHLRGLDNLTSNDIKAFASECYSLGPIEKIEWIDDTSANIIYPDSDTAYKALSAFTGGEAIDVSQIPTLQMLPAQPFPSHPNTRLEVRLAVQSDRKQVGARERSRFYLFNPEHDPAERRKREGGGAASRGGRKYRDRDDNGYRSRIYDEHENSRREEDVDFDANLYDDDEAALAIRAAKQNGRRNSRSSASSMEYRGQGNRRGGFGKELFPGRAGGTDGGRLRNRSASPLRDREGFQSADGSLEARINGRMRNERGSSANRLKAHQIKAKLRQSASSPKELFPLKSTTIHRRPGLFDAADETADLLATNLPLPLYDGSNDYDSKANLMLRITKPRLEDRTSLANHQNGFTIKGSARPQIMTGISIKGTALPSAKELFPSRTSGNAGKELFSDKLEGRGGRRRKAEDMFH